MPLTRLLDLLDPYCPPPEWTLLVDLQSWDRMARELVDEPDVRAYAEARFTERLHALSLDNPLSFTSSTRWRRDHYAEDAFARELRRREMVAEPPPVLLCEGTEPVPPARLDWQALRAEAEWVEEDHPPEPEEGAPSREWLDAAAAGHRLGWVMAEVFEICFPLALHRRVA